MVPFQTQSGFAVVRDGKIGECYTIRFPVDDRQVEESLLDWNLRLTWRGDTIVHMEPAGSRLPLYQRGDRAPDA